MKRWRNLLNIGRLVILKHGIIYPPSLLRISDSNELKNLVAYSLSLDVTWLKKGQRRSFWANYIHTLELVPARGFRAKRRAFARMDDSLLGIVTLLQRLILLK